MSSKPGLSRLQIAFNITEQTNAMLAYWDENLICRFANSAYLNWFGVDPKDMVDKMHISQLLGPLYEKNLPYIKKVLLGKVQVFERAIKIPTGETKISLATYCPHFENGKVAGFYVNVADISNIKPRIENANEVTLPAEKYISSQQLIEAVEKTLRSYLLTGFPGIQGLARKHFLSESKLKRDFKAKFNETIFSHYRRLQMEMAEKLIKEGYTKKQVSTMLNFANSSNFLVCFKKFRN